MMENKESKFKWNGKNNNLIFGLCLVAVTAFSILFAAGQVKNAQKQRAGEQQELEQTAKAGNQAAPQVDQALQEALDRSEEQPGAAGDPLAEASSSDVDARIPSQAEGEIDPQIQDQPVAEEASAAVQTPEILPTVTFSEEDTLNWPVAGSVVLDYSMDSSIYFPTLKQYKYNPALVIGSDVGAQVVAAARGVVESIDIDEETGTTLVMSLGDGYKLTYGQLKELTVSEGQVVEQGEILGYVSEPTKYYCMEGSNLYFSMTKDDLPVDPVIYLE